MRLRVKTLTRRTFGIDVHPCASIEEVKARLTQVPAAFPHLLVLHRSETTKIPNHGRDHKQSSLLLVFWVNMGGGCRHCP